MLRSFFLNNFSKNNFAILNNSLKIGLLKKSITRDLFFIIITNNREKGNNKGENQKI